MISHSIIVPNHYEPYIESFRDTLQTTFPEYEIIIASDYFGDGKGFVLRKGVMHSSGERVIFIDGDGDISPLEIKKLTAVEDQFDIVIGRRKYDAPMTRKLLNLGYKLIIRLLFGLTVDTQSGLKLWKRNALSTWKQNGFAFDIEMLAKAKQKGHSIGEVDIECSICQQKGITVVFHVLIETIKLWLTYRK